MRIARIQHDNEAVTAVIDGEVARTLGVGVLELLAADHDERERLAAAVLDEVPLAEARLLAPITPPSIRDFSVFEQHGEGATMFIGGPEAKVSPAWYERPAFYFSNPHVVNGPGDPIAAPTGSTLPGPRARDRRRHRPPRHGCPVRARRRAHRRLHDLQRLVGPRHRDVRGPSAVRLPQDQGLRQHASARGSSRPTSWSPTATAIATTSTSGRSSTTSSSAATRSPTWRGASRRSCRSARATR